MTTQHASIVDPDIHEPKGVATASANTAYIADGAGSGSWATPSGASNNVVTVNSMSDFPTAVAGVITLAENTTYKISGHLSTSDRFVINTSNPFFGSSPTLDSLTYTGTNTFLTALDGNIIIERVGIVLSSTGTLLDYTDTTGGKVCSFNSTFVSGATGSSLGTVSGGVSFIFDKTSIIGFSNPVDVTGTLGSIIVETCKTATIGDFMTLNASLVLATANMAFTRFTMGSGTTTLVDNGATIANQFNVNHCSKDGTGSFGTGFADNPDYSMDGNSGFTNSHISAQGSIEGSALTTTFLGIGAGNEVKVNFGAAFIADVEEQFTIDNTGKFTYNGKNDLDIMIDATIFGTVGGGAARQYVFYIAKNGTILTSSESKREYTGSTPGANSCSSVLEMSNGDYFELYVMAVTATTALTVDTCSIKTIAQ